MTISEKVAYLKGLADGLDLQEKPSKEGKLIAKIIDILEDVGFAVEDLEVEVEALTDEVESVAEDLSDVETMVFEDWEDEDDETPAAAVAAAPLWTTTISLKSSAPAAARTLSSTRASWTLVRSLAPTAATSSPWIWWTRRKQRTRTRNNRTRNAQRPQPAWLGALSFLLGERGDYPGVVPKTEWMPWTYRSQAAVSWASWTRPRWVMR